MWRRPDSDDIMARDDDDWVWVGRQWVYGYNDKRQLLRRSARWGAAEGEIIHVYPRPESSLALTKAFYNRRAAAWPYHQTERYKSRIRPRPPGRGKDWKGVRRPRVVIVAPESLSVEELQGVWMRLHPAGSAPPRFTMRETGLRRVRIALEERHLVLVTALVEGMGGFTVHERLHVTDRRLLPAHTWTGVATEKVGWDDVIRLRVQQNPKSEGSRAWMRWEVLRDGMSIREYGEACGDMGLARNDVLYAIDRDQVWLERDGMRLITSS